MDVIAYCRSAASTSRGEGVGIVGECGVVQDAAGHRGQMSQRGDRKEIGRHKKGKDAGVVGWAEARGDETDRVDRIAVAFFAERFRGTRRGALKVVGAETVFALLDAHGRHNKPHGVTPAGVKGLGAAGLLPIAAVPGEWGSTVSPSSYLRSPTPRFISVSSCRLQGSGGALRSAMKALA